MNVDLLDIEELSGQELRTLNRRIIDRLKYLQAEQNLHNMMRFNRGAKVSFDTRQGRELATIIKFNRKTITVETDDGERWNVPPHLLSEVKDATPEQRKLYYNNFTEF